MKPVEFTKEWCMAAAETEGDSDVTAGHQDPVHYDEPGWYFWDETWADRMGPFKTRELAQEALALYALTELEGRTPTKAPTPGLHDGVEWDSARWERETKRP